jgi:hypothetical protein
MDGNPPPTLIELPLSQVGVGVAICWSRKTRQFCSCAVGGDGREAHPLQAYRFSTS